MKRWIVDRELSCFLKERGEEVDRGQRVILLSQGAEVKRWIVDRELSCFLKERGEEVDRGQRVILLSQGER